MENKTGFVLESEGFVEIEYTDMLEKVIEGEKIILTSNGDRLYWKPEKKDEHV